jgi:hypothetical protein
MKSSTISFAVESGTVREAAEIPVRKYHPFSSECGETETWRGAYFIYLTPGDGISKVSHARDRKILPPSAHLII